MLFLLVILGIRFYYFYTFLPPLPLNQPIRFITRILDEPQLKNASLHLQVMPRKGQRVFLTLPLASDLTYGESVQITGTIEHVSLPDGGDIYTMRFPQIKKVYMPGDGVFSFASGIRQRITHLYLHALPATSASLLMGIVFGIKQELPGDFAHALQTGGVLHVTAASGMNVTLLASGLLFLINTIIERKKAIVLFLLFIFIYILIAGFEPSLLRAALMGCMAGGAALLGKQYWGGYMLGMTGFALLLYNPSLLFDTGFQLSFLATAGIILLDPVFSSWPSWSDDISTTLSAQLATLPVLLATFGQFNLLSVLVNAAVLWTVPPLMILGSIAAVVGLGVPFLATLLLYLTLPLLVYFQYMVLFFDRISFFSFTVPHLPLLLSCGYYCLLMSALLFFTSRRPRKKKSASKL